MGQTEQENLNKDHLNNPQAGDYWHDMYQPVCIVLASDDNTVTLCRKMKDVGEHRWTWDTEKIETIPKTDFSAWLQYKSPTMAGMTWAWVVPGSKMHLECFASTTTVT